MEQRDKEKQIKRGGGRERQTERKEERKREKWVFLIRPNGAVVEYRAV